MSEIASVLLVLLLLFSSAGIGIFVGPRLPAHHRTRETVELMQLTIGLLVTFAALVLGLLTASVKQAYDNAAHDRQEYALQLTLLDQCLRGFGPDAAEARADIQSYAAAVIASTWPSEPRPVGVRYPDTSNMPRVGASPALGTLMDQVGVEVSRLTPTDPAQGRMLQVCLDRYKDVSHARLSVIVDARNGLFEPFYQVLVFWLMIMFICFGLVAPRNTLSIVTIALCAVSLSSVMFVILDLSQPYGGYFSISSAAMRGALDSMLSAR